MADQVDLLVGTRAIAEFLGMTPRAAQWSIHRGALPAFRLGNRVCASRAGLSMWLREREAEAVAALKAARPMPITEARAA